MKKPNPKAVLILAFALFMFASCNKSPEESLPVDPVTINLTSDQRSLIESENTFAFDIFAKILASSGDENLIISPLSISTCLSMTLNGANGTTRDAMLEALRVSGVSAEKINNSYKDLSEALLSVDERIKISIANSVWIEKNFVVKPSFVSVLTDYYNAESEPFDITDPNTPAIINSWIESRTNGLIKDMIQTLDDNTVMLLINAIYFKGKWKAPFDASLTVPGLFYKSGGTTTEVPMMKNVSDYKMYHGSGFTVAEFPYGQGNFVMDVILPDENNGLPGIIPLLNGDNYKIWLNGLTENKAQLSFPRFKYGYNKALKEILADMGMGIAFTDFADFTNISDMGLLINNVEHQAFIETNEEGTEAAAVTITGIGTTSMPLAFNIDHPFIYIIRESTTNTILFMGRVSDPSAG